MMWSKNKILVVVIFILIIIFGFFWIQDSGDKYDQPVGGFEKIQPIIESKFGQHEDLKKAETIDAELAKVIDRKIRALYPEPGCWTMENNIRVKLLDSELKDGLLKIKVIQKDGKKPTVI